MGRRSFNNTSFIEKSANVNILSGKRKKILFKNITQNYSMVAISEVLVFIIVSKYVNSLDQRFSLKLRFSLFEFFLTETVRECSYR